MSHTNIYYNSSCSKSRQILKLLLEYNIESNLIDYLNSQLTVEQLTHIINLGIPVKDLIRTNEDEWKDLTLNIDNSTDKELINAIINQPKILQRPIILINGKAIIARPPEKALEIL